LGFPLSVLALIGRVESDSFESTENPWADQRERRSLETYDRRDQVIEQLNESEVVPRLQSSMVGSVLALSRPVKALLFAMLVNAIGYGLISPFLGVYLRKNAGLSLSRMGIVLAVLGISQVVATPISGACSDRFGPRIVAMISTVVSAIGYIAFLGVHTFYAAILAATIAGFGDGGFRSPMGAMLASLTTGGERTTVFAVNRIALNVGSGAGVAIGGLIAVASRPSSYRILFIGNAVTYLFFGAVVAMLRIPRALQVPDHHPQPSFRLLFANRWFMQLIVLDLVTALAFACGFELLPVHAVDRLGLSNKTFGVMFAFSCMAVALAQLPMVKFMRGRIRMRAYTIMHVLFAGLVALAAVAAGLNHTGRVALMAVMFIGFGFVETIFGAVRPSLTTELVDESLHGRAFALGALAFSFGSAAYKAGGGALMDGSLTLPWILSALILLAGAVTSHRMGRTIPTTSAHNPI
jgi:Na+/melibiose symporter-like transporter